jgi:hypothetical protein
MSSEELLLEKVRKEKEEMQRLRSINSQFVEKVKNFNPKPLNPSPLTLIKPFNLSTSKMLTKKRMTNSHTEEVNSKIMETMKKKCEVVGEKIKENVFINDMMKLQKTPTNVRYMKKSLGRSVSKSRSKSPVRRDCEEELMSLSSRIEKYCTISGMNASRPRSRSPVKICFGKNNEKENDDKMFNLHMNNILSTDNSLGRSTSIRKHFSHNPMTTEDKISKEMNSYKFKAKPLNRNIFAKKTEIETFESVLQKTRQEKQIIDKKEKDLKKINKVNMIKQNKFSKMMNPTNKENSNAFSNRGNYGTDNLHRMQIE